MSAGVGNRKWWIAGLVAGGLLLLTGAGWILRPAYHHFKERRSLQLAQQFMERGDYRSGLLSLRQTLGLNPNNLEAVKLMADFTAQAQSPAALSWWHRVVELAPTPENKILYAAVALRLEPHPFPLAAEALAELTATGPTNVAYHLLAAQLALQLNQGDAAEFHLAAAAQSEPTNRMHQVNLATLRLQARRPEVAAAARQELSQLTTNAEWGAVAMRALVVDALQQTNASAAQVWSRQLLATSKAHFGDEIQGLNAAYQAQDPGLPQRLQMVQAACRTNPVAITQTAMWMQSHGHARAALTWLAGLPSGLRNLPPVALVEADCFVTAQDWKGLEQRLSAQRWEDQDFFRFAYLARAFREQGLPTAGDANWNRAIGATLGRSERAAALAQFALNWGRREEAVACLWQWAKREGHEDWPLQNLLRLYAAENNTSGLWQVHEALVQRHPESLAIKNNFAMLGLLLHRDVPRASQLAREVHQAGGTNGIFASTYALALYLEGRPHEALKLLQALPESERLRKQVVPYYGLLLAACGDAKAARPLLAQAAEGSLLPEEKRLLAQVGN